MHILVVEYEQRLALLLRRVLLEERHTVDLAHDGHAGLDLALSDTYDVVILDRMLPGLDGLEICRQMRTERIMSAVLMLTARGSLEDRVSGDAVLFQELRGGRPAARFVGNRDEQVLGADVVVFHARGFRLGRLRQ